MTSDQVAATGYSTGCQGTKTCICPRPTICADDIPSMIFLTISRCCAFFDYPLYMLLFLSKTHNLNNFLQTTILGIFVNFSDYHKVHGLFGIIVGIESTTHSFFHILRWARRNDDRYWSSSSRAVQIYTKHFQVSSTVSLVVKDFPNNFVMIKRSYPRPHQRSELSC